MQLNEIKINEGKRLSFFQLFATEQLNVEIPIIQRDYAQGRKSAHEVRTQFLKTLHGYLEENIPNRDLDFVYGSITRPAKGNPSLIPLDGQQRLTTLFLLHWYLGNLSGNIRLLRDRLLDGRRSRFTYETRASAREFCDALLINDIDFSLLKEGRTLSATIMNAGWYFQSWEYDPTIRSMITMLDAIHEMFGDKEAFFDRLIQTESPVITFQFLDIGELHLTDDLYIKMNSRGKELTPFENFKAKLEKEIDDLFANDDQRWEFVSGGKKSQLSAHEYFAHSIDTKWLDFFWSRSLNDGKPGFSDEHMMNFIRVILTNEYACGAGFEDRNLKILLDTQDIRNDPEYSKNLSFFIYKTLGVLKPRAITFLISSFDCLLKIPTVLPAHMPEEFHYAHQDILKKAFLHDLRNFDRIRFHAFLKYITANIATDGLSEWMRVVYNLTENSDFDDARTLANAIREVEKLAPHMQNILQHLASGEAELGSFYSQQIEEEKIKACLILKGPRWSEHILSIEKNPFVRGQIGFLLEFSGILDYYVTNRHCNWTPEEDEAFYDTFKCYMRKSISLFDYLNNRNASEDDNYLWERSVLTKGDYLIDATYWRKNFLHSSNNMRDYSWKRLLRLNGRSDAGNDLLLKRRKLVKDVFDDARYDPENFQASCIKIISDVPNDWRAYFVTNAKLIKVCKQGFIRVENNYEKIRLLNNSKLTYHYELLTYHLFTEKMEGRHFGPFDSVHYEEDYGDTGVPRIALRGLNYGNKAYGINIFNKDRIFINFKLINGIGDDISSYDDVILDILEKADFNYPDDEHGGYSKAKSFDSIFEEIEMLCTHLHTIHSVS